MPKLSPLTRGEADRLAALNWTFAMGGMADLACLMPPYPIVPPLFVQAYEVISSLPDLCNFGLALLQPGKAPATPLPRHLSPPPGYFLVGIAAARRASQGGHPFADRFSLRYQAQRLALEQAILTGRTTDLAQAPRLMLRCLLRQLAPDHGAIIRPLAQLYDRPLWSSLVAA